MRIAVLIGAGVVAAACGGAKGQVFQGDWEQPLLDRWMYPFASAPGAETSAPVYAALEQVGFDDRDAQFLIGFATAGQVPAGAGELRYRVRAARVRVVVSNDLRFVYDPSFDAVATSFAETDPEYAADGDAGKPVELFAVGYRNGQSAETFGETTAYSTVPSFPPQEGTRSAFAAVVDEAGVATDVSRHVRQRFEAPGLAVGVCGTLTPGDLVPAGTEMVFEVDLSSAAVQNYFSRGLNAGKVMLMVSSLHPASGGPGGGGGVVYPAFYTKENALSPVLGYSPTLELEVEVYPYVDFDLDGDVGTDADIEAFFRSLAGIGGNTDFNMDGDYGTDADIESFFCALAGGSC
jgi:hypothetical protein